MAIAPGKPELPILFVESDLHGQIRMSLPQTFSIGRAISSDLVLADPSMAERHVILSKEDVAVRVEAVDGSVTFADGHSLNPGEAHQITETTCFWAGALEMRIELPGLVLPSKPKTSVSRRLVSRLIASVVLVGAIFGTAAFAVASRPALVTLAPLIAAPAPSEVDAGRVRQSILSELVRRGLGSIEIETLAEGSNRATGSISSRDAPKWHAAKLWADGEFGASVMLIDQVSVSVKAPVLAVQSAWLGDMPHIIEGSGEKLFVGAVLSDGWVIEGIEPGRVLVRRQSQHLAVRF